MNQLTESQAWQEIADRLELIDTVDANPDLGFQDYVDGLCFEMSLLAWEGAISQDTRISMKSRMKWTFPDRQWAYIWDSGDIPPRIVAAQLLALITAEEGR